MSHHNIAVVSALGLLSVGQLISVLSELFPVPARCLHHMLILASILRKGVSTLFVL